MRALLLIITLALVVVGCDGNKKTAEVSGTKDICSSTTDYETGLKNGLRVAPPCDITNNGTYKDKCIGEYNPTTWTSCYGERTLPNGEKYRGGYLEGKANGKGEFINADGTRYLGYYEKGKRNGSGKEYDANGKVLKVGEWRNGGFSDDSQVSMDKTVRTENTGAIKAGQKFVCTVSTTGFKNESGETVNVTKITYAKPLYMSFDGRLLNASYADGKDSAYDGAILNDHGSEKNNGQLIKTSHFVKEGEIKNLISIFLMPDGNLSMFVKYSNNGFRTYMLENSFCK